MLIRARRYDNAQPCELEICDDRLAAVRKIGDAAENVHLPYVAPAFFDLQINGYGGQEFSSPTLTVADVVEIVAAINRFGVSRMLPTVTTGSFAVLEHSLCVIAAARRAESVLSRSIPGIHLEGPYLSPQDGPRGAHPLEHCRAPDWQEFDRLQTAAAGLIKLVTLSPEYSSAPEFIRRAVASGVTVAIGHTAASGEQIRAAIAAGATLSTHLGNGAHRLLPRHPNYIWDQLGEDRLQASLIADGHHLPPEVLRAMVRAKTPERCILVSDLSGLAGLPTGVHRGQLCDVEVCADGRLLLAGQDPNAPVKLLAGASRPIGDGVGNVARWCGLDLQAAVAMATRHPAQLLGLPANELCVGDPADFVLFDFDPHAAAGAAALNVRGTIIAGQMHNV